MRGDPGYIPAREGGDTNVILASIPTVTPTSPLLSGNLPFPHRSVTATPRVLVPTLQALRQITQSQPGAL